MLAAVRTSVLGGEINRNGKDLRARASSKMPTEKERLLLAEIKAVTRSETGTYQEHRAESS